MDGPVAMMFVSDPLHEGLPNERLLQLFYGLTATEAHIAARMAAGHSLEVIAAGRRYTLQTIRWYGKQILAKTGCRSRAEFVRRVSHTVASLFADIEGKSARQA
jgi:DNA-binding CsgD family transcriptional regulator